MMAEEAYQGFFGAPLSYSQQYQQSEPPYYHTDYDLLSLGHQITQEAQYPQATSQFTVNTVDKSTTACYSLGPEYSPSQENTLTPGLDLESNLQNLQLNHIGSSKDTERRRQQNRNSQIAHRQRNKKLIEDLRQEVIEYSQYSQDMYHTLQTLRETTKALVSTIDQALSMHPPTPHDYAPSRRPSRYSGMNQ